ncbi:hypothetical protein [Streptomyces goshikiensis]|uniref:hypothetical protein n=1 Tax=Streptomyces goshikiensis TaxID=1942 RepID=UPI00365EA10B
MGYILYRDRTKHTETDEEMWNSPLNSYLRDHQMGHAGAICNLPDMIGHIQAIGSLWWQYTNPTRATLGSIHFKSGGIVAPLWSPLTDSHDLFTNCATEGLRSWYELLSSDETRRATYGNDHAARLLPSFDLRTYYFEKAGPRSLFIDGSRRDVPAGTVVALLVIDRVPIWSAAKYFGGASYYDQESRVSTVDYFRQTDAVQRGWKKAADAAQSTTP